MCKHFGSHYFYIGDKTHKGQDAQLSSNSTMHMGLYWKDNQGAYAREC